MELQTHQKAKAAWQTKYGYYKFRWGSKKETGEAYLPCISPPHLPHGGIRQYKAENKQWWSSQTGYTDFFQLCWIQQGTVK